MSSKQPRVTEIFISVCKQHVRIGLNPNDTTPPDEPFRPAIELTTLPTKYDTLDEWIIPVLTLLIQKKLLDINSTALERMREIGRVFFTSLLPEHGAGWSVYRTKVNDLQNGGILRIWLKVPHELSTVPWELLWSTFHQVWPATDASRTLIRIPAECDDTTVQCEDVTCDVFIRKTPLHIVVVAADPKPPLPFVGDLTEAIAQHLATLRRCFGNLANPHAVKLEVIQGPNTRQQIEARLEQSTPIHILHFFGHGDLQGDEHVLLLVGKQQQVVDSAPSTWLRAILKQRHSRFPADRIRLVVFNVCFSAREPGGKSLYGLATGIVHDGVPAVVGMHSKVKPDVVTLAMPVFYNAILNAESIDQALNRARSALFERYESTAEWATPILIAHPGIRDLRLCRSPRARTTQPTEIAREEFLEAQGISSGESSANFFAIRSEHLVSEFPEIYVDGPLRRLSGSSLDTWHPVRRIQPLCELKSFFLFAPPGYGKTSYRLRASAEIGSAALVVAVDFGEALDASSGPPSREEYLDLIMRKTYEELDRRLPETKREELRQRHRIWKLFEHLDDAPTEKSEKANISFGRWISYLAEFVQAAGFTGTHFMLDGLDHLEPDAEKAAHVVAPLIEQPVYLNTPSFAFKFFLPEETWPTILQKLEQYHVDVQIYRLEHWTDMQLQNLFSQRLLHYSQKSANPDQIDRFQQLCAPDVATDVDARLCAAAQGSPRKLIQLVEQVISTHCKNITKAEDRIPQDLIDEFLARV